MERNVYTNSPATSSSSIEPSKSIILSADTYRLKSLILWVPICLLVAWFTAGTGLFAVQMISNLFLVGGLAMWGIGLAIHMFTTLLLSNKQKEDQWVEGVLGEV